ARASAKSLASRHYFNISYSYNHLWVQRGPINFRLSFIQTAPNGSLSDLSCCPHLSDRLPVSAQDTANDSAQMPVKRFLHRCQFLHEVLHSVLHLAFFCTSKSNNYIKIVHFLHKHLHELLHKNLHGVLHVVSAPLSATEKLVSSLLKTCFYCIIYVPKRK